MDQNLIIRTARKTWRCERREHHVDCGVVIRPGLLYVEYLGETPAFQSGTRYSVVCARDEFGEEIELPTCDHGVVLDGVCADCRERRTGVPERDEASS